MKQCFGGPASRVIAAALVADFFILRAAKTHHKSRSPMWLCVTGAISAVAGHLLSELLELVGFSLLIAAAIQNFVLLRRHRTRCRRAGIREFFVWRCHLQPAAF